MGQAPRSSNSAAVATIIYTAILTGLAVPYLFAAMFSVMMFDAPGSTSNPWVWLAFLSVCSYPMLLAILAIAAWVSVATGKHARAFTVAVIGSVLAATPALLFFLVILFE